MENSKAWSGRQAFQLRGPVTGLQVGTDSDGLIFRHRLRHGEVWEDWRSIGWFSETKEPMTLESGEVVAGITSGTIGYGRVVALEVTTSTGRLATYGRLEGRERKESVVEGATLAHCSGRYGAGRGGRSITFHWSK